MISPFEHQERAAGATFVERFGVEMPEHFGDPDIEYRAARDGGGLLDLSFRGVMQLTGSERLRWLNGQITNDVQSLKAGEGVLAAVLTVKGHLLSDVAVYGMDASVWIDLPRERAGAVGEAFERRIIADDVQVEILSDRFARLLLVGPRAASVLAAAGAKIAPDLPHWHHAEVHLGGVPLLIVSNPCLAIPGFDLIVPVEAAGPTWDALLACGREAGVRPVGMTALECLRVEAGWPWFGVDYDESNLLMESLAPAHVSFAKGCYVGQEVVIRIEHQGHVNKKLCGLSLEGTMIPARGAPIGMGDRTVGQVTSAVRSPTLGRVVALGYLRRECWTPGTRLHVGIDGTSVEASVATLPFVGEDPFGRAGGGE